jgi:hypothetical protein
MASKNTAVFFFSYSPLVHGTSVQKGVTEDIPASLSILVSGSVLKKIILIHYSH